RSVVGDCIPGCSSPAAVCRLCLSNPNSWRYRRVLRLFGGRLVFRQTTATGVGDESCFLLGIPALRCDRILAWPGWRLSYLATGPATGADLAFDLFKQQPKAQLSSSPTSA